jgi:hypothetical protein
MLEIREIDSMAVSAEELWAVRGRALGWDGVDYAEGGKGDVCDVCGACEVCCSVEYACLCCMSCASRAPDVVGQRLTVSCLL